MKELKEGDIVIVNPTAKISENCILRKVRMVIENIDKYGNVTGVWQDEDGVCYWASTSSQHFIKEELTNIQT